MGFRGSLLKDHDDARLPRLGPGGLASQEGPTLPTHRPEPSESPVPFYPVSRFAPALRSRPGHSVLTLPWGGKQGLCSQAFPGPKASDPVLASPTLPSPAFPTQGPGPGAVHGCSQTHSKCTRACKCTLGPQSALLGSPHPWSPTLTVGIGPLLHGPESHRATGPRAPCPVAFSPAASTGWPQPSPLSRSGVHAAFPAPSQGRRHPPAPTGPARQFL